MGDTYENNALNDILFGTTADGRDRFKGTLDSIGWVTAIVDKVFVVIISLSAFLSIMISIARAILTLLYCSFPQFFDAISNAKRAMLEKGKSVPKVGWLISILALFVPDVRAVTMLYDVDMSGEGANKEVIKTLGIRVLGQTILIVALASLVMNGGYRNFIAQITDASLFVLHEYVFSVDLKKVISNTVESGKNYEFNYPSTSEGKVMRKIADDAYKAILNYYPDLKSEEDKWNVGQEVENWVNTEILKMSIPFGSASTLEDAINAKGEYKISVNANTVPKSNADTIKESEHVVQQTFYRATNTFGFKSATLGEAEDNQFVRLTILVQAKDYKQDSNAVASQIGKLKVSGGVYQIGEPGSAKAKTGILLPDTSPSSAPENITIGSELFTKVSYTKEGFANYESKNSLNAKEFAGNGISTDFKLAGFATDVSLTYGSKAEVEASCSASLAGKDIKGEDPSKVKELVQTLMSESNRNPSSSQQSSEESENTTSADIGASGIE